MNLRFSNSIFLPLQSHQVTQIAKVLRQSRGVQDPSIVYEDKTSNRKLVYKIMSRDNARAVAKNASASSVVQPPVIHNHPPSSRYFLIITYILFITFSSLFFTKIYTYSGPAELGLLVWHVPHQYLRDLLLFTIVCHTNI